MARWLMVRRTDDSTDGEIADRKDRGFDRLKVERLPEKSDQRSVSWLHLNHTEEEIRGEEQY